MGLASFVGLRGAGAPGFSASKRTLYVDDSVTPNVVYINRDGAVTWDQVGPVVLGTISTIPKFTTATALGNSALTTDAANKTLTYTPVASAAGSPTILTVTAPAHTTLANAEAIDVNFNLARTVQFTGNVTLATQRAAVFQPPTYSSDTATKTITTAATLAVTGNPAAGANVTITYPIALWVNGRFAFGNNSAARDTFYSATQHWGISNDTTTGGGFQNIYFFEAFYKATGVNSGFLEGLQVDLYVQPGGGGSYTGGVQSGIGTYIEIDSGVGGAFYIQGINAEVNPLVNVDIVQVYTAFIDGNKVVAAAEFYVCNTLATNALKQFSFVSHTITMAAGATGGACYYAGTTSGLSSSASVAITGGTATKNYAIFLGKVIGGSAGTGEGYGIWINDVSGAGLVNDAIHTSLGRVYFGDNTIVTQPVYTSGSPTAFTVVGGAHTSLATAEDIGTNFNFSATKQFTKGGGTIATQREVVFQAPTYGSTAATLTFTNAATVAITGAPAVGANAAITRPSALWVQAGEARFDQSMSWGVTTFTTGPQTLDATHNVVLCDTTLGAFTVNLPATAFKGRVYTIKLIKVSTTLTIGRNGNKIDDAASDLSVTTVNTSYTLVGDGTDWWII